jgi:hypothetical protein
MRIRDQTDSPEILHRQNDRSKIRARALNHRKGYSGTNRSIVIGKRMSEEPKKGEATQETKTKKSIDKRVVELHPKFLEAIRDTYPLAVLGSLCIAIAAFSAQTYPNVQVYAITSASLFLIAFVVSFAFKVMPNYFLAVLSYASTGMAILLLFFVVGGFMKTNPLLSNSVRLVENVPSMFAFLLVILFFYEIRKRTKSKTVSWCCLAAIPFGTAYFVYYLVLDASYFLAFNLPPLSGTIFLALITIVLIFMIIVIVIEFRLRKKKNETIPQNKV